MTLKMQSVEREKIRILKQTELFGSLDEKALRSLAARASEKQLRRGEILFLAGDRSAGLWVVAEGTLRAFRTGSDGREQVKHVEQAVTTIAELPAFDGGNYPSTVAAEEDSRLYFIRKEDIHAVSMQHPELALAAARLLARRLRKCAELVESLSLREVGQRVAGYLLDEAVKRGKATASGSRFELKVTHGQLAARIGTVRESVSRAFLRLQAQDLIKVTGKTVEIADIGALRGYVDSE